MVATSHLQDLRTKVGDNPVDERLRTASDVQLMNWTNISLPRVDSFQTPGFYVEVCCDDPTPGYSALNARAGVLYCEACDTILAYVNTGGPHEAQE